MLMRVLVTGNRDWVDAAAELDVWALVTLNSFVVVHGDCPTGVDRITRDWCQRKGVHDEPHPADWALHGRAAGPIRNKEMAAAGADMCLAFPLGRSAGTRGCMRAAQIAGIPVMNLGDGAPNV